MPAFAQDFMPLYSTSLKPLGTGVFYASSTSLIYSEPDKNSRLLEVLTIDKTGLKGALNVPVEKNTFIALRQAKNTALFNVIDEKDNWYKVIYDSKSESSGWIEKTGLNQFHSWKEFIEKEGRKNGLYFFRDFPAEYRKLRVAPDENAQVVHNYVDAGNTEVKIIRGNWMLVRVINSNITSPIGWMRWRNDDGQIFLFPQL
jgi:hypothetical protein